MTISELQILLDINKRNEQNVLEEHARWTCYGFFFVDSEDGQCYLLNRNGKLDGIIKVKTIDEHFVKKDIQKIVIPKSVESIGAYAFINCKSLASIEIPESATSIGYSAFYNCTSLTTIEIPTSVESIGDEAFSLCTSLTSIKIPDSVKSIGDYAFYNCKSLTSIEIPNSVESIEGWAFSYCKSLTSIIFKGKTFGQVKVMDWYPWGIEDEAIIKCS